MSKVTFDRLLNKQLMHTHDVQDIDGLDEFIGVTLNGKLFGGAKTYIGQNEILDVPLLFDYNTYSLNIEGKVEISGQINIQ